MQDMSNKHQTEKPFPQKNCFNCQQFRTNIEIRALHKSLEDFSVGSGDKTYPLDVEWKNCLDGPDVWLNCRKRKRHTRQKKD